MEAEKIISGWVSSPNSRGTLDIIWSSLFAIFLSTWTTLHLNVPSPRDGFLKIAFRKFKWMLFTALIPEMTVMFALAQWIQAKKTARFLKDELGCQDWGIRQGFYVEMGGLSTEMKIKTDTPRPWVGSERSSVPEQGAQLAAENQQWLGSGFSRKKNTNTDRKAEEALEIEVLSVLVPETKSPKGLDFCCRVRSGVWEKLPVGRIQLKWLIEKGYLERRDHMGKLNSYDMVEVTRGERRVIVPCIPDIKDSKIREISRSDIALRMMWVIQVCWYLLQCIARAIQSLSVSLLELSTVALIICAIIIHILWWYKPLDVQSSISILINDVTLDDILDDQEAAHIRRREEGNWQGSGGAPPVKTTKKNPMEENPMEENPMEKYPTYVYRKRVNNDTTTSNRAVIALPIVGFIFGGVHMIAWQFYFHTEGEQHLWRIFTILVAGTPIALAAIERLGYFLDSESFITQSFFWCLKSVLLLVYAASRIYLFGMAFVSLRHLPESAYQTVQWANYWPHL